MPNTVQLKKNGQIVYPITDVSCVMGLEEGAITEAVISWDGASTPVVANIPAGVVVTYNGTSYTGTLAASSSTVGIIYMVATGSNNVYDRYLTVASTPNYAWSNIGNTTIDLSTKADKSEVRQLEAKVVEKIGGDIDPSLSLEQGAIASVTGLDTTSTTRIRTANYITADKIRVATSGSKVYVMGYKEDGTFVSAVGWITTSQDVSISGVDKYRFTFAYSNDATITPEDFSGLNISIKAEYERDFATIEEVSGLETRIESDIYGKAGGVLHYVRSGIKYLYKTGITLKPVAGTSISSLTSNILSVAKLYLIPVSGALCVDYYGNQSSSGNGSFFVDSNGLVIDGFVIATDTQSKRQCLPVPSNAAFFLWSSVADSTDFCDIYFKTAKEHQTLNYVGKTSDGHTSGIYSTRNFFRLTAGKVYRVTLPSPLWDRPSLTVDTLFYYARYLNGSRLDLYSVTFAQSNRLPKYFDIIAEDNDYYEITIRASVGEEVTIYVDEIDPGTSDVDLSHYFTVGKYIDTTNGTQVESSGAANISFARNIPTLGKKYIDISAMVLLSTAASLERGYCFYDKDGNVLKTIRLGDIYVDENQRGTLNIKLPIPKGAAYFNATFWGYNQINTYPTVAANPYCVLTDKGFPSIKCIDGQFDTPLGFAPYDGTTGATMMGQDYATFIGQWEAIRTAYSDRVTRNLLGYATAAGDTSSPAEQDTTRPIYEYVVKPLPKNSLGSEEYATTTPNNTVKVLLCGGVHGAEKPSSTAVLEFMKNLLGYYPETKLDLSWVALSQNVEYHIIPCVNPYGYDNNDYTAARLNARGVNINRNFGHNWTNQSGNNTSDKGPSAYSELETVIVKNWILANKDAIIYVDNHTSYVSSSPKQGCYAYTYCPQVEHLYNSWLKTVSVLAQDKWPTIFSTNQYIGFNGYNNLATSISEAHFVNNIPFVATLEVNTAAGGNARGDAEQTILSTNQLANFVRFMIAWSRKRVLF